MRRRRQSKKEARFEVERETEQFELFHGYRTPIQVCPRGCGFNEQARRDLIVRTGFWGRANVAASSGFETTHCPWDGAKLIRICARCERPVFAPVVDHCEFCGVPQPWAADRRAGAERASLRHWRVEPEEAGKSGSRAHDPAVCLYGFSQKKPKRPKRWKRPGKPEKMKEPDPYPEGVWALDGNIARLAVDAVISNDDVDGQMWSQSARAIKNAAGEGVERLAQEGKPFQLGHAWLTDAGDLKQLKGIIHVASMSRYGKSDITAVRKCLTAALDLAAGKGYKSVGLTAFGEGPAAIDLDEWIEVFAEATVGFLSGPDRAKRTEGISIVLVLFERHDFEGEVEKLRGAFRRAWVRHGAPHHGRPLPWWPVRVEARHFAPPLAIWDVGFDGRWQEWFYDFDEAVERAGEVAATGKRVDVARRYFLIGRKLVVVLDGDGGGSGELLTRLRRWRSSFRAKAERCRDRLLAKVSL